MSEQFEEFSESAENANGALVEVERSRAIQEVQAAMIIAKRFPRDREKAYTRILESCKRPNLAKVAIYAYPRGGETVRGPSIRLAEVLAQNWGNLQFGLRELTRTGSGSEIEAYCWDIETNVSRSVTFHVPHLRYTKQGTKKLTDPRDIYEMVANNGARRLRACILNVIPGDITDAAVNECRKTAAQGAQAAGPLIDRVRRMAEAFYGEFGVPVEAVQDRLGHPLESTTEDELSDLREVYQSIKDGIAKREEFFVLAGAEPTNDAGRMPSDIAKDLERGVAKQADAAGLNPAATEGSTPSAPIQSSNGGDNKPSEAQLNVLRDAIGKKKLSPEEVATLLKPFAGVKTIDDLTAGQYKTSLEKVMTAKK